MWTRSTEVGRQQECVQSVQAYIKTWMSYICANKKKQKDAHAITKASIHLRASPLLDPERGGVSGEGRMPSPEPRT
jgi:hypothetical protein